MEKQKWIGYFESSNSEQNKTAPGFCLSDKIRDIVDNMACYCQDNFYPHSVKNHQGKSKALISYDNLVKELEKLNGK